MADEGVMPEGTAAPRPAPRAPLSRPAPPPRHTHRNSLDPAIAFRQQQPTETTRPDNRLALVPHPAFDPRYRNMPPQQYRHPDAARSAEQISKALVLRGVISPPPGPRLIRPSEHLAMIDRAAAIRNMDVYGVDPASSVAPLHRRPPDRPPPHLVPIVTVLEAPRIGLPAPRMPTPTQRPQQQRYMQRINAPPPRMPAPAHVQRLPQPRYEIQHPPAALAAPPAAPVPAPALPPGLFGAAPRTIVIHRPDARHGFGFTLRHLVVYPPDSLNELYDDGRHLAVGVLGAPMDTIFVRSVRAGGPAAAAGLRAGDRVVAVNDEPVLCGGGGRARAPYARVVQLAQREPRMLRLTVVPRDHDLLQRYFSEAAYNPETNQRPRAVEMPAPTLTAEHESRLFDAYRKPRALLPSLPGPQAPPREADDAPEYSSVASLQSARYDPPRAFRDDRRESDASLPSAAESKDSLGSFDSGSTLTGRELDDSIILSRIRKSLEQKEAFLRRPSQPTGWVTPDAPPPIKQKEFYARPQKMQKTSWPPPATSPPPVQEVRQREDDCAASVDSGTYSGYGEINGANIESKSKPKSDKNVFVTTLSKIQENAPSTGDSLGSISNGSSSIADDSSLGHASMQDNRYPIPAELQIVTARTRQFESPASEERTALYRSELARLSTTKPEPTVALRRREYETRGVGAGRREARSLDAQPSREEVEIEGLLGSSLSGNRLMITGSKHLHCPPPEGYVPEVEKVQMRTRSNSTGSEGLPTRRHHASDGGHTKRRFGLNREQMEAMNRASLPDAETNGRLNGSEVGGAKENGHNQRLSQNGEAPVRPQRPTQLSLAPPGSNMTSAATTPASPSPSTPADSGFADDSVTRRQKKDAQMGEEERAMRRVSYLKATWGDRLHLDSDTELSDADNHALRSLEKKGEETSSPPALDEELEGERGVDIHGNVQVKMVVSNGKRASDRSWKQVWAALQGPKLHLYRHHSNQSPATASSGGVSGGGDPHGSRDSLDVRYSMAVLADDYTKRKHVLRLTTAAGAELLLQADGAADAARWLRALKRHSAEPAVPPAPLANNNNNTDTHGLSPLPPQRSKKIGRNRSPTGPPTPTLPSSPKTKTWKGRMARQLRRMHGGGGGATAPAAATGWLGAPLERCPSDPARPGVPLAVSLCAAAVEAAGLRTVGVYRVPGNAAGVASLAAALDRGEPPPPGDTRWADVHVASSLLKNYLRRLPDSLLTADLYPAFIAAERAPPAERARELRRLVRALPDAHYETLKFLMEHLRRIVAHSDYNKMEARNLAIVFGPTLVRGADDDMLAMVNDMSSQCRIIESLVNHYEWYFDEDDGGSPIEPPCEEELAPSSGNRELLIHNVKKIEGKDVSTRDIVSSIISAANRKIQRKPRSKPSASTEATKKWSESTDKSPVSPRMASAASPGGSPPNSPPPHLTTPLAQYDGLPIRSYSTLNQTTQERIKKFELETIAMLQRAGAGRGGPGGERTEAPSRAAAADLVSKELAAVAGKRLRSHADLNIFSVDGTGDLVSSLTNTFDQKLRTLNNSSPLDDGNIPYADECQDSLLTLHEESKLSETTPSEGSINSEERVSPSIRTQELKTAWLSRDHRKSSSSSAEETDGKFDKYKVTPGRKPSQDKSKYRYDSENDSEKENCENPKKTHERNYEEKTKSPENKYECNDSEKDVDTTSQHSGEALPDNDKSIERLLYSPTYPAPASTPAPAPAPRATLRLSNPECIKRNSAVLESDTEPDLNKKENNSEGVKLKRSESLNREPERSESRVLRSESLNCRTESRLQRSESLNKAERLSKLEKTESNLVRRREAGAWRSTKLKRKNGMPERGIKRRHTVGGTKDFDKDGWSSRHTRTSSPDLTHVCLAPLVPPPRPPLESHV